MPNANIICEILGYKYRYFADTKTPSSLYTITALLLRSGLIRLNDIYSWLSPADRILQTEWQSELDDAKEYVRKLNVISINKDKEPEAEVEKDDIEVSSDWHAIFDFITISNAFSLRRIIMNRIKSGICVRHY